MVAAEGGESSPGRTVVVAVKLDSNSRELLTWALLKVAQVGDQIIALHVLHSNEIVDQNGKASLLSLVKAFDSILAVYEGFCSLKQIDLKLKICRGSSVRKILVRESKSYNATELILGAAQTHHKIRSSVSVAKYCAKKLPKECSVLAISNGKTAFYREPKSKFRISGKETGNQSWGSLLDALQRKFVENMKKPMLTFEECACGKSNLALTIADCSVCSPDLIAHKNTGFASVQGLGNDDDKVNALAIVPVQKLETETSSITMKLRELPEGKPDDDKVNALAIVPVQKLESETSSITMKLRELPEGKPGWPLLRRAVESNRRCSYNSQERRISVVQWAIRLPNRYYLKLENSGSDLNEENGAIVPVNNETTSALSSPDYIPRSLLEELEGLHEKYSANCRLFIFKELVTATSNFVPGNMVGKGGSSEVYRGCLPDGKELAVKILKPSQDAVKEFLLEIEIITTLHHKNIISLFGFCFEDNHLLLVYDLLSRGSLEQNLHGHKKEPSAFGWSERYRVAIGVAEALDYLHNRENQPVIHRDVKSSNILLSDDFEPQLSDFGLAKWASATSTHTTCTDVAGTFGYLAPEYFMYGKVNEKIDVYAYGVVLLELLSGRKPISSNCPKGQESLVLWAKPFLNSDKFTMLLDPDLNSNYDHEQVERMVLAASLCIRRAPKARPQMSLVLKLLQGNTELTKWARLQVNGADASDDETLSPSNLQSHLNLALLGVDEDSVSISSICPSISLEDYLRGRWSRSSSFD